MAVCRKKGAGNGMGMKDDYYREMEAAHQQYDIFLHDVKHMMRAIFALSKEGECDKIGSIIENMGTTLGNIRYRTICSHTVLNALVLERSGYAESVGVELELDIREPLCLQGINDKDLIALMGNLLDNAIKAEEYADHREGIFCSMTMAREGRHIIIQTENSYDKNRKDETAVTKEKEAIGDKHGIGRKSIQQIIEKYGGIMEYGDRDGRYWVKIIIPVQTKSHGTKQSTIA